MSKPAVNCTSQRIWNDVTELKYFNPASSRRRTKAQLKRLATRYERRLLRQQPNLLD